MKLNFKNIIIIFLVALIGGVVGTFGVLEINKATGNKIIEKDSAVVLTTVDYPEIKKSDYSLAIEKALPSVVEITSTKSVQSFFGYSSSVSMGSGVIVSNDGYIVTNNHVVESAVEVEVKLANGLTYQAKIIGTDSKTDLAVLKIEADNLYFSTIADSDELVLGQETIVIGNPLGEGISCSNGIISALAKEITIDNYTMTLIQTNAAVNEGNSGGGLFNMAGDLIGIVNAKSSSGSSGIITQATVEGMGYAIPSNTVNRVIRDLVDYGYVKQRATLGVSIYTSTTYTSSNINGVIVADVVENGAADKAGIKQYDIIAAIDDRPVEAFSELGKILDDYNVGDEVTLLIYRGYGEAMQRNQQRFNLEPLEIKVVLQENVQ